MKWREKICCNTLRFGFEYFDDRLIEAGMKKIAGMLHRTMGDAHRWWKYIRIVCKYKTFCFLLSWSWNYLCAVIISSKCGLKITMQLSVVLRWRNWFTIQKKFKYLEILMSVFFQCLCMTCIPFSCDHTHTHTVTQSQVAGLLQPSESSSFEQSRKIVIVNRTPPTKINIIYVYINLKLYILLTQPSQWRVWHFKHEFSKFESFRTVTDKFSDGIYIHMISNDHNHLFIFQSIIQMQSVYVKRETIAQLHEYIHTVFLLLQTVDT